MAIGIAAYFKYPILFLKFTASLKGTGFSSEAFCSMLASNNSDLESFSLSCNTFNNLSFTSGKCFPIIFEATL